MASIKDPNVIMDALANRGQSMPQPIPMSEMGQPANNTGAQIPMGTGEEQSPIEPQSVENIVTSDSRPVMTETSDTLDLIKELEGYREEAYQDEAGKWTIGFGTTQGVKPGMTIDKLQAQEFLERDAKEALDAIDNNVKVELNPNQKQALVSFVYNIGAPEFKTSTILKKINKGDFEGAAKEFKRWKYVTVEKDGKKTKVISQGLINRRKKEAEIFAKAAKGQGMEGMFAEAEKVPRSERPPTLEAYNTAMKTGAAIPKYSEDRRSNRGLTSNDLIRAKMTSLGRKSPEQRAKIGRDMGILLGSNVNPKIGGIIGAGVGGMMARAIGAEQDGTRKKLETTDKIVKALNTSDVAMDNMVEFSDGTKFNISPFDGTEFENVSSVLTKKETRGKFEVDPSNPLTKRTLRTVAPIAQYLLRQFADGENMALPDIEAMLTNMLQENSSTQGEVNAKAREFLEKLGLDKNKFSTFVDKLSYYLPKALVKALKEQVNNIYG